MIRFKSITKPIVRFSLAGLLLSANIFSNSTVSAVKATGGHNNQNHKINICHVPPGNPENSHVIEVDLNAWNSGHDQHNSHSLDFKVDSNHPCPPIQPSPTLQPTATPTPTKKPCPTKTPTPTQKPECHHHPHCNPSPTPTPEVTPSPTPDPEVTPTPTPGPQTSPAPQPCNGCGGWPSAPTCGATVPPAPVLLSTVRRGSTALLTWTAVVPVTHYTISYGLTPDNFIYGVPNTGNVTSFTVGALDPNTKYYFSVRAVNDCAPSDPSGGIGGGQVLGASTLAATGNSSLLYLTLSAGTLFSTLSILFLRFSRRVA